MDGLASGIPYETFWGEEITPKWFNSCVKAYNKRLEDSLANLDTANYQLGLYIQSAMAELLSDTNKHYYPKEPQIVKYLDERAKNKNVKWYSREETEQWLANRRKERQSYDKKGKHTN